MIDVRYKVCDRSGSEYYALNTKHGDVALERSLLMWKHLSAVEKVSVCCLLPTEVQKKPGVAVMMLPFLTSKFASKVGFFLSFVRRKNIR